MKAGYRMLRFGVAVLVLTSLVVLSEVANAGAIQVTTTINGSSGIFNDGGIFYTPLSYTTFVSNGSFDLRLFDISSSLVDNGYEGNSSSPVDISVTVIDLTTGESGQIDISEQLIGIFEDQEKFFVDVMKPSLTLSTYRYSFPQTTWNIGGLTFDLRDRYPDHSGAMDEFSQVFLRGGQTYRNSNGILEMPITGYHTLSLSISGAPAAVPEPSSCFAFTVCGVCAALSRFRSRKKS